MGVIKKIGCVMKKHIRCVSFENNRIWVRIQRWRRDVWNKSRVSLLRLFLINCNGGYKGRRISADLNLLRSAQWKCRCLVREMINARPGFANTRNNNNNNNAKNKNNTKLGKTLWKDCLSWIRNGFVCKI